MVSSVFFLLPPLFFSVIKGRKKVVVSIYKVRLAYKSFVKKYMEKLGTVTTHTHTYTHILTHTLIYTHM